MEETKYSKLKLLYDLFIALLAVISITVLIIQLTHPVTTSQDAVFNSIDTAILIVFAIDYFVRLFIAKDKRVFFKKNIPDLLSIIPFNLIFQAFSSFEAFRSFEFLKILRLEELARAARLISIFAKFSTRTTRFLKTNNFIYIAYITGGAVLFGAVGLSYVEKISFSDAIWCSIVTTATVGYGDVSPATAPGRIIAIILMLTGIGFLGMLTGTISTYFIHKNTSKNTCNISNHINLDGLNNEDIKHIQTYIDFIRSNKKSSL